jgi:hypothetical protein
MAPEMIGRSQSANGHTKSSKPRPMVPGGPATTDFIEERPVVAAGSALRGRIKIRRACAS